MKKVLVTGGTGFIGSHCLQILSAANEYEIHATTHSRIVERFDNVTWHEVDLLDPCAVFPLLTEIRPSHLLHLAWYAVPGKFWSSMENFKWVSASLALLQAFAKCGGERCVLAGSCAEYDWRYGYCAENLTPCEPATIYGTCKHSLRQMANVFCEKSGLSNAWGRIFFLYGPNEPPQKLVTSVIMSLLKGQKALCSHGEQIRDFLFVHDVAAAFVGLLEGNMQGPVNISSGKPVTLKEIILTAAEMLNGKELVQLGAIQAGKNEPDLLVGSNRRLVDEAGWLPRYDLQSGLEETINCLKDQLSY